MLLHLYALIVNTLFWVFLVPFFLAALLGLITSAASSVSNTSKVEQQPKTMDAGLEKSVESSKSFLEEKESSQQNIEEST